MYFFTSGTAKDAAQFMDTVEQLSQYVATSGWKQASALSKVMTNLKYPTMVAPVRPTRTYLSGSVPDAVETTDRITLGVVITPMVNDINYQDTMDEYLTKKRRYNAHMDNCYENNAKGYYLVLQHCSKEIEAELRNQDSCKAAEDARSVIAILLLIRDFSFNKTYRKRSIMATVESDADLYLGMQQPGQSTDDFYKTFTAQLDTINANGGSAGFHKGVYNKHMMALRDRDLDTAELLAAMIPAEKLALENRLKK